MKKFFVCLLASLFIAGAGFAQCDKNVVYSADRLEIIGASGEVEDSKTEAVKLEFTKEKISLSIPDKGDALTGTIKETDCQWKTLYKEGKAVYKLDFQKPDNSDTSEGTITIEAKEGALTITIEIAKMDGRKLKLPINKYEEK